MIQASSTEQVAALWQRVRDERLLVVAGWSGAGKTTLLERLIRELERLAGWRVAAVKHAHHPLRFDGTGTDSQRLFDSGAAAVAVLGPDALLQVSRPRVQPTVVEVARALRAAEPEIELVLAEGFKTEPGVPKIEVRASASVPSCTDPDERLAVIGDDSEALFGRDDVAPLAQWLLDHVRG